jgi:hypothetical protein
MNDQRCFINQGLPCNEGCMAFCGKKNEAGTMVPACTIVNAISMMGLVSAHAYQEVHKAKMHHPPSAPPPEVRP